MYHPLLTVNILWTKCLVILSIYVFINYLVYLYFEICIHMAIISSFDVVIVDPSFLLFHTDYRIVALLNHHFG